LVAQAERSDPASQLLDEMVEILKAYNEIRDRVSRDKAKRLNIIAYRIDSRQPLFASEVELAELEARLQDQRRRITEAKLDVRTLYGQAMERLKVGV
jgi:hypothetical protein